MRTLRVLIVEDDTVSATMHKAMLEAEGHTVVGVARSEQEAIKISGTLMPDVVLMDIYLEGNSSGVNAAKEIYSAFALPVLFITCGTAVEQLQELVDSDAFALIKKPVSLEELRVNLSIVMRREQELRSIQNMYACWDTLLNMLPAPVVGFRNTGELDWCNAAFMRRFGFADVESCRAGYTAQVPFFVDAAVVEDVHSGEECVAECRDSCGVVSTYSLYKMEHPLLNNAFERVFFMVTGS